LNYLSIKDLALIVMTITSISYCLILKPLVIDINHSAI